MHIKFIYPDSSKTHTNHSNPIRQFFRTPPLNLLMLAGLTSRNIEVEIIDERYKPINFDAPVDLVAITSITSIATRAYQIGDKFKNRGVKFVIFIDDNMFAKPKYAKEMFHSLMPLKIKWGVKLL